MTEHKQREIEPFYPYFKIILDKYERGLYSDEQFNRLVGKLDDWAIVEAERVREEYARTEG